MVAVSSNQVLMKKRGRGRRQSSSSSRSIKVFANHHHQRYNKRRRNNIKKKKMSQQADDKQKLKMNNNRGTRSSTTLDDDFVLCEILSRLPVKTLMRFKSVCKHWRSSIQHDPHFCDLHARRRPLMRFFYINTTRDGRVKGRRYRVSDAVGRISSPGAFHPQRGNKVFAVNGLVCLVDNSSVCIVNPCTREETQWIQTTKKYKCPSFVFGFDRVSKKHKVFCHNSDFGCEVLTVGNNSWRRIDRDPQIPPYELYGPSVHVDGAIYWVEPITFLRKNKRYFSTRGVVLLVFDLGIEKFGEIPIPDFIINQPRDNSPYWKHWSEWRLLEVDGRLALLRRRNKNTVGMWILYEDDATDHNHGNWTEVIITLPFDWEKTNHYVHFLSVPRGDQITMESLDARRNPYDHWGRLWRDCDLKRYYSHNWKKNTSEELFFERNTSNELEIGPFTETLLPVNNYN